MVSPSFRDNRNASLDLDRLESLAIGREPYNTEPAAVLILQGR